MVTLADDRRIQFCSPVRAVVGAQMPGQYVRREHVEGAVEPDLQIGPLEIECGQVGGVEVVIARALKGPFPGILARALRTHFDDQIGEAGEFGYLALYELETDDLAATLRALMDAIPGLDMGDSLDSNISALAFTPITDRVTA